MLKLNFSAFVLSFMVREIYHFSMSVQLETDPYFLCTGSPLLSTGKLPLWGSLIAFCVLMVQLEIKCSPSKTTIQKKKKERIA